eukprot:13630-Heterococcus_DN1.PRE.1
MMFMAMVLTFEVVSGDYPTASYRGAELSSTPWHGMGMIDIVASVARGLRPTESSCCNIRDECGASRTTC